MKTCKECGTSKPHEKFHPHSTKDGRRAICADCANAHRRADRVKNVEKERQRDRERYRTNPERRFNTQKLRAANIERYKANDVRRHALDPRKKMLRTARFRAQKHRRECTLVLSDIVVPEVCPLLGIPIFVGSRAVKNNSPTLDRKDSSKGYTPDNVWVVSWRANRIKSDATLEEMKLLIKNWP